MGISTFPQSSVDNSLAQYFSWAGAQFPFNSGASDITISGATTWNDAVGYKKVGKLTINAGQTLTIQKSPFYIFADEINFGDTASTIDASGLSGSTTPTVFPTTVAAGATSSNGSALSQGGGGGGMLFIICNRITGANGLIKANGGNGYRNASTATTSTSVGGQGALSKTVNNASSLEAFHLLIGVSNYQAVLTTDPFLNSILSLLGNGGTNGGVGGGSGVGGAGSYGGGGSGIGGGASAYINASYSGLQPTLTPTPLDLLMLAILKCLGGGGGGATVNSINGATNNSAGGGGGGSIVIFTHTAIATPSLQANGGSSVPTGSYGAAGITYLVIL